MYTRRTELHFRMGGRKGALTGFGLVSSDSDEGAGSRPHFRWNVVRKGAVHLSLILVQDVEGKK